jgi:tetratricopeptide (TPR) repeat protein
MAQTLLIMAERNDEPPRLALPAAEEAVKRALESDPQAGEAQATFGMLASVYFHDFGMAERSFQRAIDAEPNNATARQLYSYTLVREGRFAEAMRQAQIAVDMDPLSQVAYQNQAVVLFYSGRYPELIAQADALAELNPSHYWPTVLKAYAYAKLGRRSDAIREIEASLKATPPPMVLRMAGEVYALLNDRAKALDLLRRLERMRAAGEPMPASYIGFLHAALGDVEESFRWLETAWTDGDSFLSVLLIYPACAPLRPDPRFHNLVARLGVRESMVADSPLAR